MNYLAFDKSWFKRNQWILIRLLNIPIIRSWFRYCLRIQSDRMINRIEPNSYWFEARKLNNEIEVSAEFHTHWKYSKRLYHAFKPLWWMMHFWDWLVADRFFPVLSFGFLTLTAFPDPDPETTTVDGSTRRDGVDESWATIRAGAGNGFTDASSPNAAWDIIASSTSNQFSRLARGIYLFDTSSLTSSASISAATLSLFAEIKSDGLGATPDTNIYSSSPASNTGLANADFSSLGSTAFSTAISYASITTSVYNDFALNANGIANISKTSVSKFGCRNANYDVANSSPTWVSLAQSRLVVSTAENAGTTQDPKLVITYTLASAGFNNLPLLGVS